MDTVTSINSRLGMIPGIFGGCCAPVTVCPIVLLPHARLSVACRTFVRCTGAWHVRISGDVFAVRWPMQSAVRSLRWQLHVASVAIVPYCPINPLPTATVLCATGAVRAARALWPTDRSY